MSQSFQERCQRAFINGYQEDHARQVANSFTYESEGIFDFFNESPITRMHMINFCELSSQDFITPHLHPNLSYFIPFDKYYGLRTALVAMFGVHKATANHAIQMLQRKPDLLERLRAMTPDQLMERALFMPLSVMPPTKLMEYITTACLHRLAQHAQQNGVQAAPADIAAHSGEAVADALSEIAVSEPPPTMQSTIAAAAQGANVYEPVSPAGAVQSDAMPRVQSDSMPREEPDSTTRVRSASVQPRPVEPMPVQAPNLQPSPMHLTYGHAAVVQPPSDRLSTIVIQPQKTNVPTVYKTPWIEAANPNHSAYLQSISLSLVPSERSSVPAAPPPTPSSVVPDTGAGAGANATGLFAQVGQATTTTTVVPTTTLPGYTGVPCTLTLPTLHQRISVTPGSNSLPVLRNMLIDAAIAAQPSPFGGSAVQPSLSGSSSSAVQPSFFGSSSSSAVQPSPFGSSAVQHFGGSAAPPTPFGGSSMQPSAFAASSMQPSPFGNTNSSTQPIVISPPATPTRTQRKRPFIDSV